MLNLLEVSPSSMSKERKAALHSCCSELSQKGISRRVGTGIRDALRLVVVLYLQLAFYSAPFR